MAHEVKLEPGWLKRDTERASERVAEWQSKRIANERVNLALQVLRDHDMLEEAEKLQQRACGLTGKD